MMDGQQLWRFALPFAEPTDLPSDGLIYRFRLRPLTPRGDAGRAPFAGAMRVVGVVLHGAPTATTKDPKRENVDGQFINCASTNQMTLPCGNGTLSCVSDVLPSSAAAEPFTDAKTRYPEEPDTDVHVKVTGEARLEAPAAGVKSVGDVGF